MNHSGIASLKKVILISSLCVYYIPLKEALSVHCTAVKVSVFLFGVALSPNQYDAFSILTQFSPFLRDAFFNCSCLQMV